MARPSKLTPEKWALVRRRWEGCDRPGFDWLAKELHAAYPGVNVSRQGVSVRAAREGWEKGGEKSEPLAAGMVQFGVTPMREPIGKPRPPLQSFSAFGIPTADELAAASFDVTACCGIYFLLRAGCVMYVGQSGNVLTCIGQHMRERAKDFDAATFMPCKPSRLDATETLMIHAHRPPLNGDWTRPSSIPTPLRLETILDESA